jgi:hypothetical protein
MSDNDGQRSGLVSMFIVIVVVAIVVWRLRSGGPKMTVRGTRQGDPEALRLAVERSHLSAAARQDVLDRITGQGK